MALSESVSRGGRTPILALLTDGRANVARDGGAGRARAEQDALSAAARVRAAGLAALLVDISPRPQDQARQLAAEMRATYLPLPYADAAALSRAVRTTAGQAGPKRTPGRP
jgi:magnesium chelatase subunit D